MRKAFLLGAGLGTRLQPLTRTLPKPLIPYQNRPLITHVMDHCLAAGITDFAINTHHLHEAWETTFPDKKYRGATLTFFHEPVLLETGGGIKNIADWINNDPILVYNGDIVTDLPIDRLMTRHMASNNTATLAIQDHGPALHISTHRGQITDIRGMVNNLSGTHQFVGIYTIDPEILDLIPPNEKISIIPAFLELIRKNELGAYLVKEQPRWLDLGTRETYLSAHASSPAQISPSALIDTDATIENSWIADGCQIEAGAIVKNSIVWPGTKVLRDAELTNCIVHSNSPASGVHRDTNL